MASSPRSFRYAGSLIAAAASWGVATALSKHALARIHPILLLATQLGVSVAFLMLAMRLQGAKIPWSPGPLRLGALGVLNPGISYALSFLGLASITASLSTLLWAIEPVLILVLARLILGERLRRVRILLSVAALGGVMLLLGGDEAGGGQLAGVLLTMAGVGCCAIYTVQTKRLAKAEDLPTLSVVMAQQAFALAWALLLLALIDPRSWFESIDTIDLASWLVAGAAGIMYYAIAFWFYLVGLRHYPATLAGLFLNLIPLFGVAAGYLLLGERLSGREWAGGVVILVSVVAVTAAAKVDR